MNTEKLKELDVITQNRIDKKLLVSAAYAVVYKGKTIYKNAIGDRDIESGLPLKCDTVMRLASMTKPITGIAVMRQVERGALSLDDEVCKYIPSFSDMKVAIIGGDGKISGEYPARSRLTVRDLLNHSSGLGEGEAGNIAWKNYHIKDGDTLSSLVPRFGEQLLDFEPHTKAIYSWTQAFDTAAYLVELTSGEEFEEYLKKHILYPLGCFDTCYTPDAGQRERMMKMYDARDGKITPVNMRGRIFADIPDSYRAAGASMVGTLDDYLKIAGMLAGDGEYGGVRILKPETVRLMRTDSLTEECEKGETEHWGLSMRVIMKKTADQLLNPGSYGWSGAYGTHFFIDPSLDLYGVYMKNLLDGGGAGADTAREFERIVMDAAADND